MKNQPNKSATNEPHNTPVVQFKKFTLLNAIIMAATTTAVDTELGADLTEDDVTRTLLIAGNTITTLALRTLSVEGYSPDEINDLQDLAHKIGDAYSAEITEGAIRLSRESNEALS